MFMDMDDNNDKMLTWDEFSDVFAKKDPKKVQYVHLPPPSVCPCLLVSYALKCV